MKTVLSAGYVISTFLIALCPMQMTTAMGSTGSMHEHAIDTAAMTPAISTHSSMSMPSEDQPGHHSMPTESDDCQNNHCLSTSQVSYKEVLLAQLLPQLKGLVALPPLPPVTPSLPDPPESIAPSPLAKAISTIVLIV